jgi:hypothetical protein
MNQECCDGQVGNILNESKCGYEICRAYGLKFYYNPKEYKCISKSGKDTFERIYIENSYYFYYLKFLQSSFKEIKNDTYDGTSEYQFNSTSSVIIEHFINAGQFNETGKLYFTFII